MSDDEQPIIIPETSSAPAEEMALQVSWEEEARIIKELTEKSPNIVEGEHYYVISTRWFKTWKMYTNYDWDYRSNTMNHERPGPIDNSTLVDEEDENYIKKSVLENIDFIVVPEEAWDRLHAWYGGGPVLRRKAIKVGYYKEVVVEIRPLRLKIVTSDDLTKELICYCSKTTSIQEFSDFICDRLELDPAKIRIFDFHANTKIKQLTEMEKSMEDSQIIDNQKVLIELQKEDGTWPDVPSRSGGSSYGGYSGYSSYSGYSGYSSSSYSYGRREPTTPGLCGLMNLGNTCFMASALQCLSNSTPLTRFFLTEKYKRDLNRSNPLGMQGELADEYAKLLAEMWSGNYSAAEPRGFKFKIERFAPQFAGYNQHDSQELLAFLLDGLHEDLNRISTKPYVEAKDSNNRPDAEVAAEAWEGHKRRNDSIIVDWFQGQLKSTLVCPDCGRVSVTFDPFMYLSLPMPHKTTRDIKITMHFLNPEKKLTRYLVSVEKFGSIPDLKQNLSKLCGIPADLIVLCDVFNNKFYRQMKDNENVEDIGDNDVIHGYELSADENVAYLPVYWRRDERTMKTMFGVPFIISVPNNITYRELYKVIAEQYIARFMKKPVPTDFPKPEPQQEEPVEQQQTEAEAVKEEHEEPSQQPESMEVDENKTQAEATENIQARGPADSDDDSTDEDSSSDDEIMSYALRRARATANSDSDSDDDVRDNKYNQVRNAPPAELLPGAVFSIVGIDSWGQDTLRFDDADAPLDLRDRQILALHFSEAAWMEYYSYSSDKDVVLDDSIANPSKDETRREMSLYDCLELFTKEETLSKNDPWYCSNCKDHKQATKKFDLWKVPPIIVIHLKRFSYRNRVWREKLETFVDFPIDDLDLSQYALGPHDQPLKYELFAVSNHMGSLTGGHYTAYGKNYKTGKWYSFDDSRVSNATEEDVKSNMAYLLFYRRKDLTEFTSAADESTSTANTSTADATTAEAETNAHSSDSENDSDNAEEGSNSNDDHLLADIEAPRADFGSLHAGARSDDDD